MKGDVQGRRAVLRARLPELFGACETVVDQLYGLGTDVLLLLGRADGPFTAKRWSNAQRRLVSGQSKRFTISRDVYFPGGHHSVGRTGRDVVSLHVDLDYEFAYDVARIELTVERERDHPIDPTTALSWVIDLARASGLAQASLHPHDYRYPPDPVHAFSHMSTLQEAWRSHEVYLYEAWPASMLERFARGAAWVLHLNPVHVAGLGGPVAVADQAPVERVTPSNDGGAWLVLTENPDNVTSEAVLALEQYLGPILPTVDDVLALSPHEVGTVDQVEIETDDTDRYIDHGAVPVELVQGRVGMEMSIGVMCDEHVGDQGRRAVERCVKAWVADGTQGSFGGDFHGWAPGAWDDACYELDVDTGAQEIDWPSALAELARRLGGCAATHGFGCTLRVGDPA